MRISFWRKIKNNPHLVFFKDHRSQMLAEVKKKCSRFQCKDNDAAPAACFLYLTATKSVLLILLIEFAIFYQNQYYM